MAVKKDKQTLKDIEDFEMILSKVQTDKKPIAEKLIKELTFMNKILDTLKKTIDENGPVENFKQGSQEFLRESPALKGYNTTIQRYSLLYKQLEGLLPKTPTDTKGNALLQFIKNEE
jgi:hypothetical protein